MADQLEKQTALEKKELEQAKEDPKVPGEKNNTSNSKPMKKLEEKKKPVLEGLSILNRRKPGNPVLKKLNLNTTSEVASMVVEITSIGDNFTEAEGTPDETVKEVEIEETPAPIP